MIERRAQLVAILARNFDFAWFASWPALFLGIFLGEIGDLLGCRSSFCCELRRSATVAISRFASMLFVQLMLVMSVPTET